MFGLGFSELLLIMVVILIVFGPDKLPEIARNVGRATGQLRRTMDEFKHEINLADADSHLPPATDRFGCEADRLTTTGFGPDRTLTSGAGAAPAAQLDPASQSADPAIQTAVDPESTPRSQDALSQNDGDAGLPASPPESKG